MTARSYWRGHKIEAEGDDWFYSDTGESVQGNERPCGHCGKQNTPEGHDGCLGTLPGVMNACCGHGDTVFAYIQFADGTCRRGADAIEIQRQLKEQPAVEAKFRPSKERLEEIAKEGNRLPGEGDE